MFGYSMCFTDDKPLTKIKQYYNHCFLVMMNTGLQTGITFQRLLINVVIKYFERFTQIVGLFGSLKQFYCL